MRHEVLGVADLFEGFDLQLSAKIRTAFFNIIWMLIFAISLPWLAYRFTCKGKNKRGWRQKLFGFSPTASVDSNAPRIWLHAVSLGEVHLLKTLIDHLTDQNEHLELYISTTTETGFDRASELFSDHHQVFFFPFDFSWAIRKTLRSIKPEMIVLAELELWPNLIHISADLELPVFVANARLSESSFRNYQRLRFLTKPMFSKLVHVAAQDAVYAQRFKDLGCDESRVTVSGNLKYDSICTDRSSAIAKKCRDVAADFGIVDGDQVLVAGSTQIEDEAMAVDAWLQLRDRLPGLKLILIPRHPDRIAEVEALLKGHAVKSARRSSYGQRSDSSDVLIVDVIGELSGWWALADVAFVGGSMGSRGGQNMIEPAALGIPVCFGPNTANFRTTVDGLLGNDAAVVVHSADELSEFVSNVLNDTEFATSIGKRAQSFVLQHQGAASGTVELIRSYLNPADDRNPSNRSAA